MYFLMTSMGAPSRGEQAEAAAPKLFTPKLLPYPRILLFKQAVAGALVNVDELAQLTLGLRAEQDMHMVYVMVPFLDGYPVFGRDVLENLTRVKIVSSNTLRQYFITRTR